VDDPYTFGQVAAANALSDIYAMGGRPLTAMNIVCFPINSMNISVLQEILAGGVERIHEAGVSLVGGHSVEDQELKYGLSVAGIIHPQKVILNTGARVGDVLVLTKKLGTGIVNTAVKGDVASDTVVAEVVKNMITLNRQASDLMLTRQVHACTDVTGFGLLGHACEMIANTEVGLLIDSSTVPYFAGTRELAEMGMLPGGLHRNREFHRCMIDISESVPQFLQDILFDPQTSGGLLIAVLEAEAGSLVDMMRADGIEAAAVIGQIVAEPRGRIVVR
jgi:selenide,water dikinase